jgi:hypothetical protein
MQLMFNVVMFIMDDYGLKVYLRLSGWLWKYVLIIIVMHVKNMDKVFIKTKLC